MGHIQWTVSLVLIGLFAIAIIGYAVSFANDNNAAIDISDDPEISSLNTRVQGNVSQFISDSEGTYNSIINSTIAAGDTTTASGGQFKLTPASAIGTVKNIIQTGYVKIFGSDSGFSIFLTALFSLIGFITILLAWKAWAGRNPE